MTETIYALDASAVLRAFFDEPGAEVVAGKMNGALPSAVNYHEIVAKLDESVIPLGPDLYSSIYNALLMTDRYVRL